MPLAGWNCPSQYCCFKETVYSTRTPSFLPILKLSIEIWLLSVLTLRFEPVAAILLLSTFKSYVCMLFVFNVTYWLIGSINEPFWIDLLIDVLILSKASIRFCWFEASKVPSGPSSFKTDFMPLSLTVEIPIEYFDTPGFALALWLTKFIVLVWLDSDVVPLPS